ncbi:MAG: hypothetical protein ACOCZ2_00995 [Thermodesulfobacteriota bacterium]
MQSLKALINNSLDVLGKRSQREKLLFAVSALVVIFILWHVLVFEGQKERLKDLKQNFQTTQKKVTSLSQEQSRLSERLKEDKLGELRDKVDYLQEEVADLDARLREKTGELISPRSMTRQLRKVMQRSSELELVHLSNHPPQKVTLQSLIGSRQDMKSGQLPEIYRHPLSITFKGSYLQALRAFQNLEDISSSFFWDNLEFKVVDHPRAFVRLQVHTLSLEKVWLGF